MAAVANNTSILTNQQQLVLYLTNSLHWKRWWLWAEARPRCRTTDILFVCGHWWTWYTYTCNQSLWPVASPHLCFIESEFVWCPGCLLKCLFYPVGFAEAQLGHYATVVTATIPHTCGTSTFGSHDAVTLSCDVISPVDISWIGFYGHLCSGLYHYLYRHFWTVAGFRRNVSESLSY